MTKHPKIFFDPPASTAEERVLEIGMSKACYREILEFLAKEKLADDKRSARKRAERGRGRA